MTKDKITCWQCVT